MSRPSVRRIIRIQGIVQGVGFRPFIHRLAIELGLSGSVCNDAGGVLVDVEGAAGSLTSFVDRIPAEAPPLALVDHLEWTDAPSQGRSGFEIVASSKEAAATTLVSPDVATCADCLRELMDPNDRRHRFPFINCTNCGPRYTIIRRLPYDRPATTMDRFTMCPACEAEYRDPTNRRFHAQPNACWSCGPRVELWDNQGLFIPCRDPIEQAGRLLSDGRIVAVKGLGGFHLAVDARNEDSVQLLRRRKRRDEKPFALMAASLAALREIVELTPDAEVLLRSPQRPVLLLPKRSGGPLASAIAPGNRDLGVMLPYTPIHHLLLADSAAPWLVMTSGNFSEEPIIVDNRHAAEILAPIADYFLVHNRDILVRNDDSVCRSFRNRIYFIRRSRGYAPAPVKLSTSYPSVLAVGAELKNTVAVNRGEHVFLSQHIGDLENSEVSASFEQAIQRMQELFEVTPALLAYDLHPEYLSTKYAMNRRGELPLYGIQHHHAHIAACLAENGERGPVIGLALDGTGYGPDGRIWGGEVLVADLRDYERVGHFRDVAMPGGSRAIREPWRMAVSYLHHALGSGFSELPLPFLSDIAPDNLRLVIQMIERRMNSPETSSCGRLFDGFAALSGSRQRVTFEGQAAMEFEMLLDESDDGPPYPFPCADGVIEIAPAVRAATDDVRAGVSAGRISARFHRGLVRLFADLCRRLSAERGIATVALSGGVFQNLWLLRQLSAELQDAGLRVLLHRLVPCNDGGIALGQLAVAAERHVTGWEEPCV